MKLNLNSHPLTFSHRSKVRLILQTEAAECGLACLAMVAGYHGHRTDLATLRQAHSVSLKGTTLARVIEIAERLELDSRPVRLELEDLEKLRTPAVLHWDLNHFVVLAGMKREGAVIMDPAHGRRTMSLGEVSKHFTGVALELLPRKGFRPKTERRRTSLGHLIGRMRGVGRVLGQILLLGTALEVLLIAGPFFMQLIVDHVAVARDEDLLHVLGAGFLLLTVIKVGVTALRSWVVLYLATTLNVHLMTRLFGHLLHLPMGFFARRHLGDVVSRFESLNTIQRTLTNSFVEAMVDGLMALITLCMMSVYSWRLALIVCGAAALYGALRLVLYPPFREATEEQIVRAAKQQTNFLETVRGMQSVKLFNRQQQRGTLYHNLAIDQFNAGIRVQKLNMGFQAINGALFGIENIAVLWFGGVLVLEGGFSVGMLFAFVTYKDQFTRRVASCVDKIAEFRMLGLHTERVADIALTEPEPEAAGAADIRHASLRWTIELRTLGVRYAESEPFVLRHLSLRIEEGESVAIVGPSGCGKTTLLKVILGLLPPTEGEMLIGGMRLPQIGMTYYRTMIGAVMQDDHLFAGSIADNIAFFDPESDMAHVERCARLAAVHQDIVAMPMGYNTLIGDMGTVLSGGQKQRVLLARALYKNPKILFLDEATSHLDVDRERQISDAITQLKLTRVIVAHRPETIAGVDRVISLAGDASPRMAPSLELVKA